MGELRPWHIIILVIVIFVLFGYKKLPDATRSLGRSLRILKTEVKTLHDDDADKAEQPVAAEEQVEAPRAVEAAKTLTPPRVVQPPRVVEAPRTTVPTVPSVPAAPAHSDLP